MNTYQINTPQDGGRNQLATLHGLGLLAWTPEPERLPRLVNPYDESADLDRRARSYLADQLRPLSPVQCRRHRQYRARLQRAVGGYQDGRRQADPGDVQHFRGPNHRARRPGGLGVVLPRVQARGRKNAPRWLESGRRARQPDDPRLDRENAEVIGKRSRRQAGSCGSGGPSRIRVTPRRRSPDRVTRGRRRSGA